MAADKFDIVPAVAFAHSLSAGLVLKLEKFSVIALNGLLLEGRVKAKPGVMVSRPEVVLPAGVWT